MLDRVLSLILSGQFVYGQAASHFHMVEVMVSSHILLLPDSLSFSSWFVGPLTL